MQVEGGIVCMPCGKKFVVTAVTMLVVITAYFVLQKIDLNCMFPKEQVTYAADTPATQPLSMSQNYTTAELGITASTDNTQQINEAIASISATGGGVLKFSDDATYMVDALTGITMQSNVTLDFSSGAKLKAIPNAADSYTVINIHNVQHVGLIDPHVIGDKDQHNGTTGEWGMGISIKNSQYVDISNAMIENCWGDGIYLGSIRETDRNQYIHIKGKTTIKNCRRQGVSVISALDSYIENLRVEDISGTLPAAAIDFEPNYDYETIENFEIGTLMAVRCKLSAVFAYNSHKFGITINNIISQDCVIPSIIFSGNQHNLGPGYIKIGKLHINNLGKSPAIYKTHWYEGLNPKVNIESMVTDN
jgi:hypothetical protein